MLSNNLNTNEIKNKSGTEVEFQRLSQSDRSTVFAQVGETPNLPHRLTIKHEESGSGIKARRRTLVRFDKTQNVPDAGSDDVMNHAVYLVMDIPIGVASNYDTVLDLIAQLNSFMSTLGTNTFLYDGTGTGSAAIVPGGL
jgi:hypothetical protein